MLAAVSQWGVEEATKRFNGMFASPCGTSRPASALGTRPPGRKAALLHGWVGDTLVFGSELKVSKPFPASVARSISDAIAGLLRLQLHR